MKRITLTPTERRFANSVLTVSMTLYTLIGTFRSRSEAVGIFSTLHALVWFSGAAFYNTVALTLCGAAAGCVFWIAVMTVVSGLVLPVALIYGLSLHLKPDGWKGGERLLESWSSLMKKTMWPFPKFGAVLLGGLAFLGTFLDKDIAGLLGLSSVPSHFQLANLAIYIPGIGVLALLIVLWPKVATYVSEFIAYLKADVPATK